MDVAKQMGMPQVMISCDKANIASSRTIISCGGVLAYENFYEDIEQQFFWINLEK
jgi:predicted acetyltransferase